jgi:hypothetical protein
MGVPLQEARFRFLRRRRLCVVADRLSLRMGHLEARREEHLQQRDRGPSSARSQTIHTHTETTASKIVPVFSLN